MTDLPASTAPAAAAHPLVKGRCPACRGASLFLGSGGYVTCSRLDCPDPTAADDLLHGEQRAPAPAATQATGPREHCGHLSPNTGLTTVRTECVLRPGHQGSHADDVGCRWWYDPTDGNHTGPSRVVHTASTTPPTENP
ncbi:hypothetical protein [Streptomyces tendae]|uniref:hypothetical protein n=1 Tax=Streptomyces tendae TaxID=1932 RepID=UPI0037F619C4